jgi:hypothetical protein
MLIYLSEEEDFLMPTYLIFSSIATLILSIASYYGSKRKRCIVDYAGMLIYLIPQITDIIVN